MQQPGLLDVGHRATAERTAKMVLSFRAGVAP
jgi:hypothetical protein